MNNGAVKVVKSAGRALKILEVFAGNRRSMLAKDIAAAMDMPRSSANVLLTSLVNLGYLRFDSSNQTYFPTQNVRTLGSWLHDASRENQRIDEMLEDLNTRTGETVALAVQDQFEVRFVRVLASRHRIALQINEGDRIPLFRSASGRALLSLRPDGVIESIIAAYNETQLIDADRIDEETALAQIREIRRTGLSIAFGAFRDQSGSIAIPLSATRDRSPTTIGIGGPADRIKRSLKDYKKLLRELREKHDL